MRKKKNLAPRMERCETCWVREPEALRGSWRSLMPEAKDIHLEIGCGKGRFTVEMAKQHPETLFLAVERVLDAMVVAMERAEREEVRNVFFLGIDARSLPEVFAPGEIQRIYLNFSDPWPGNRHAKRRLTHGNFLRLYRAVLSEGGALHIKTDNSALFDFSLAEIPRFGFVLSEVTRDLHADGPQGVMTDYERKFYEEGLPIHRCVATMVPWQEDAPQGGAV
ncbi:MAG: tRNA (guanosine(46)-N7)-methyltransferase TrmB [Oscillospiraceae bacterium]